MSDVHLSLPMISSYLTCRRQAWVSCAVLTAAGPLHAGETGKMTREIWTGMSGGAVADFTSNPRYWQPANQVSTFSGAAAPSNIGDSYASRVRGYITAPVTGDYTFWIAADDTAELWLSSDASKFGREKIAYLSGWVGAQAWDAKPSQKSAPVHLEAGQKYFIEALHKEASGGDHLAIAWQTPGGVRQLIPASALESFTIDPDDVDNDDLSDAWETTHGFDLADNGTLHPDQHPLADPDQDGYTNYEESRYGTNPYERAGLKGSLSLDTWLGVPGAQLAPYFLSPKATQAPDWAEFVGSAETPANRADSYAARLRGHLLPPVTGNYTFYVAGDDEIQLWLSSGESQFAKQKIAFNRTWTNPRQWTKSATQKSVPVPLQSGKKYYLEAWVKEGGGGDHLAVGWQKPGSSAIEVIPGTALASHVRDAADADGDDLPDAWEIQHGLDPAVNDAAADPDHDLLSNLVEYMVGTDPQVANGYPGGWMQEIWWNAPGTTVADFVASPRSLAPPDSTAIVTSSEFGVNLGDHYARRVRGHLIAPVTGDYRLWIASDDSSELWLSPDEFEQDRQRIAFIDGWVARNAWDTVPSQQSASIHLTAGSRYYLEALQTDAGGADHLSIAWQTPGGTREPIPVSSVESYVPPAADTDGDGLPDAWERRWFGNLDQNASGDHDLDGISNLQEYQQGTVPRLDPTDSDGDGLPDAWEIHWFGAKSLHSGTDDPDGDGMDNAYEFAHGTDPNDFFNGETPVLRVTGGDSGTATFGNFLDEPLQVTVNRPNGEPFVNAAVTFRTSDGYAGLAEGSAETTVRTTAEGASVAFRAPGTAGTTLVTATLSTGQRVTFRIHSIDPNTLIDPATGERKPALAGFVAAKNPNGTVSYSWMSMAAPGDWFELTEQQPDGSWKPIYKTTYGSAALPYVPGETLYKLTLNPATDYLP